MRVTSISARNFLSFGPDSPLVSDFSDVNIIVGPNGSGKTNLLKAVDFVGLAFEYSTTSAAAWVYKGDVNRRVVVDVGVRFDRAEQRILTAAACLGFDDVRGSGLPGVQIDLQAATRAVRDVLRESAHVFEPLFGNEVHFCAVSRSGHAQAVTPHLRFTPPQGDFYLAGGNELAQTPFESGSWSGVQYQDEILSEIRRVRPGAYEFTAAPVTVSPEDTRAVARALDLAWIRGKLAPREGIALPVAAQLATIRLVDGPFPRGYGQDPQLVELVSLLRRMDYHGDDVTLFQLLSRIYGSSVVHATDARSKTGLSPPGDERRVDFARTLLDLKVSRDTEDRNLYARIQQAFESLTHLRFDAVQESRTLPSAQGPNQSGESRTVASVIFADGTFSYASAFAAAGVCEILYVLCASCGPSGSVLLLDEPALNLHPTKQRELYSHLVKDAQSSSNQIFLVTHSSSFVSPRDLTRALRLVLSDGMTQVHRLSVDNSRDDVQMMKDVERFPRLLDALFAKGVILLEGYQEEAGLPPWFLKCDGGSALLDSNVLFLTVAGDTAFRRFSRVLDAWGIPYMVVADGKSRPRVAQFGDRALTYPEEDFPILLEKYYPEQTKKAAAEFGGYAGVADPVVARLVAIETPPPEPIQQIWSQLRPFVVGVADLHKQGAS